MMKNVVRKIFPAGCFFRGAIAVGFGVALLMAQPSANSEEPLKAKSLMSGGSPVAKVPKGINPFSSWLNCPSNLKELNSKLSDLDSISAQFSERDAQEKFKTLSSATWQAVYLEHLAPYLLPDDMRSEVAKSCWIFYEDIKRQAEEGDLEGLRVADEAWLACLAAKYPPVPKELLRISDCVRQVSAKPKK